MLTISARPAVLEAGTWAPLRDALLGATRVFASSLAGLISVLAAAAPWFVLVLVPLGLAARAWRRRRRGAAWLATQACSGVGQRSARPARSALDAIEGHAISDLTPLPSTPLGLYRHYKGGEYEVIGVARHSETNEPLVVYRPLYNATGWWVRPQAMFFEAVVVDGVSRARFEKVG